MKTTILLSMFLIPSILLGQAINHFDDIDSKWNVAKTYPAANQQNPDFVATTTTVYGFQGDTLIDNELWFKFYSTSDSMFQSDLLYHGLLRVENNKVFYLDTLNQLDALYDFSLNVGDSVLYDLNGMFPEWLQVINVDSIQINGDYYRRLKFAEPIMNAFDELNEVWIEGIGSVHGPLFPYFPVKFSQEIPDSLFVTCTFSGNQQVWQHQSYSGCYINIVLSVDQLDLFDFKIYPNPFMNIIHIENIGIQEYELTMMNSMGQIVKQLQINNNNTIIDLSELKSGIYFLRIESRDNAKTMRIIKKY